MNMAKTVRVLHVLGMLNLGGAESRIMDLYRQIDKNRVQFDFLIHTNKECYFDKEVIEMGGRIFRVPPFRVYNILEYCREMRSFFAEHNEFAVVQGHMTSTAGIYLPIAKRFGIKITIAHARSAGVDKNIKGWITRILRIGLHKKADICFTCSELAGISVFGKRAYKSGKVKFLPNAINAVKYRYDNSVRQEVRSELNVHGRLVIGHVGSFRYAKNHEFLIKVFAEILKVSKKEEWSEQPLLVMLGEGELMESIKKQVENLGIYNHVMFLGNKRDAWRYYQAFDYVVFPSWYEGMPGTIVEAQTAGLRCLISERISKDVIFTDLVKQMDLEAEPEKWARYVIDNIQYQRKDYYELAQSAGFDIVGQAEKMLKFYETGCFE